MAEEKRGRGRPKGSGHDLSRHLSRMADLICRRETRFKDAAAKTALKEHGPVVSLRHLVRVYDQDRRELEVQAMRRFVYVDWQPFPDTPQVWRRPVPDGWQNVMEQAEKLEAEDPRFSRLAKTTGPGLPLHRWYPAELLKLFEHAGIEPDPLPE